MASKESKSCCPPDENKPDLRPAEGRQADEELALMTKALGHSARVQILRLLTHRNTCICGEIVESIDLAQSTVSQHLKVLKDAGLIQGDVKGTSTCYCINAKGLRRLKVLVAAL